GTVHKTAWDIMDSGIPLAILPLGTANNLARSLGFTGSVDEILQSVHCGKSRPFDVGVARRSSRPGYFLEAAGGGVFFGCLSPSEGDEKKGGAPQEGLHAPPTPLGRGLLDYSPRSRNLGQRGK